MQGSIPEGMLASVALRATVGFGRLEFQRMAQPMCFVATDGRDVVQPIHLRNSGTVAAVARVSLENAPTSTRVGRFTAEPSTVFLEPNAVGYVLYH